MKFKLYNVEKEETPEDLSVNVTNAINDGWELYEKPYCYVGKNDITYFCQPLTKVIEIEQINYNEHDLPNSFSPECLNGFCCFRHQLEDGVLVSSSSYIAAKLMASRLVADGYEREGDLYFVRTDAKKHYGVCDFYQKMIKKSKE